MKNKIIYTLFSFFVMITLTSCLYEDLGNYDYKEKNNVVIKGLITDQYINKMTYIDKYGLFPEVEFLNNKDENNYQYKWEAFRDGGNSSDTKSFVLGEEKNLDSQVILPAGNYVCYYHVTDKSTDITFSTRFYLHITASTEAGWCVLCDVDGVARFDILIPRPDGSYMVINDAVSNINLIGKPQKLFIESSMYTDCSYFYVAGDKGTYKVLNKGFNIGDTTDLRLDYGLFPDKVLIQGVAQTRTMSTRDRIMITVDEKGDYYTRAYDDDGMYTLPQNFNPTYYEGSGETQYFVTAPWIGVRKTIYYNVVFGTGSTGDDGGKNHNVIIYDQTYKRFLKIDSGETKPAEINYINTEPLWEEPVDKRMIYGQNITIKNDATRQMFLTLLTDETDVWLYGITPLKDGDNRQEMCIKLPNGADILNSKSYTFPSNRDRLYYTKGSAVWMIDFSNKENVVAREVLDFPNEEVVKVAFWDAMNNIFQQEKYNYYDTTFDLVVGSNVNGENSTSCGVLRSYDTKDYTEKYKKQGLGKIVDICFKEKMDTTK